MTAGICAKDLSRPVVLFLTGLLCLLFMVHCIVRVGQETSSQQSLAERNCSRDRFVFVCDKIEQKERSKQGIHHYHADSQ